MRNAESKAISLNYLENGFDGISKINGNESAMTSGDFRVRELKEHFMWRRSIQRI